MGSIAMAKTKQPDLAREFFEQKLAFVIDPVTLDHSRKESDELVIVDVREAEDFEKGHIPGAINLPSDKWHTLRGLDKDKVNVIYCYNITCHLGARGAVQFASQGYPVMELEGGFETWKQRGFDVETRHSALGLQV